MYTILFSEIGVDKLMVGFRHIHDIGIAVVVDEISNLFEYSLRHLFILNILTYRCED
jgi:hypothetical protein